MFRNVKKEEITIPAQMSYLIQIREFIEHIGKRYKYSEKMVNSFKLVIDEACTNIIRHGYRDIKNGEILIKAIIRRLSLTIVIVDQGVSYDPRQANTPNLENYVNIGKKGGLGILMMRKLMDDLQYAVTERGNEFRLTKMREVTDEHKLIQFWHGLNMLTRYSVISAVIITLIISISFFVLIFNVRQDVTDEVFSNMAANARVLAEGSVNDLGSDNPTALFENTFTIINNADLPIFEVFIVDNARTVRAVSTKEGEDLFVFGDTYSISGTSTKVDSLDGVVVTQFSINDSLEVFDAIAPIKQIVPGAPDQLLGEAHIWVDASTISDMILSRRITLIISLIIILAVGYLGSFYLVSQILKSFTSLADWVRQVVRGKVDQDEIDIDTSDEIGEIADAFNEMTKKFRMAQVDLMEQQKLQKELQVAQEIQQMLLPSDFPQVEGFDLGSYYEAAKEVGGDLFDFVDVDEETVGIIVADVSGKGVPGSLIMTMIRTAIRLESRGNKNPADVLARVNRFVTDDMRKGMFVTMFYVILDSRNRVIHYASAGHNPMMLYRSSSKQTYYLNPSGFPVGLQLPDVSLFDKKIETDSIRLREDDILVLYTDGITEAMNHQRELYREERFLQSVRDNGHLDVSEFVVSVKDDLKHFTGGAEQNDDITFVAIKEKMMAGEVIYNTHKNIVDLLAEGMRVKDACEKLKISQYQYYKYKNIVDSGGLEALRDFLGGQDHIEKKHISIEVKSKIFDIIRSDPQLGPKSISHMLRTEKYGKIKLDDRRIYNDLVKLRLNTTELRERFVEKGQNKRLKQPGTPLLTLDGKVILNFESSEEEIANQRGRKVPAQMAPPPEERTKYVRSVRSEHKSNAKLMVPSDKKEEPRKTADVPPAELAPVTEKVDSQTESPSVQQLRDKANAGVDIAELERFFVSTKDDFENVQKMASKIETSENYEADIRKMILILKITTKNPILKKLQELEQLILMGVAIWEIMADNVDQFLSNELRQNLDTVLKFLEKENILNNSNQLITHINKLGLIHKSLQEKTKAKVDTKSGFDELRNTIQKKSLVKDAKILKSLSAKSKK